MLSHAIIMVSISRAVLAIVATLPGMAKLTPPAILSIAISSPRLRENISPSEHMATDARRNRPRSELIAGTRHTTRSEFGNECSVPPMSATHALRLRRSAFSVLVSFMFISFLVMGGACAPVRIVLSEPAIPNVLRNSESIEPVPRCRRATTFGEQSGKILRTPCREIHVTLDAVVLPFFDGPRPGLIEEQAKRVLVSLALMASSGNILDTGNARKGIHTSLQAGLRFKIQRSVHIENYTGIPRLCKLIVLGETPIDNLIIME